MDLGVLVAAGAVRAEKDQERVDVGREGQAGREPQESPRSQEQGRQSGNHTPEVTAAPCPDCPVWPAQLKNKTPVTHYKL